MKVQHTMNYEPFQRVLVSEVFESSGELWLRIATHSLDGLEVNAVKLDGTGVGSFNGDAEVVIYPDAVIVLEGDSVP